MNYSDYRFSLDIQIHQAQVSVPVTFGDSARRLCIGLTDGRKPYIIGEGCRAVFNAKKPDGKTIKNDCIIERNTILYEFTTNTTNAEGVANCEITLYDAKGKVLTSPQFIIVVDKRVVRDEEIPLSESESTTIDKLISMYQSGHFQTDNRIYIGSGEMPDECDIQIDPSEEAELEDEIADKVLDRLLTSTIEADTLSADSVTARDIDALQLSVGDDGEVCIDRLGIFLDEGARIRIGAQSVLLESDASTGANSGDVIVRRTEFGDIATSPIVDETYIEEGVKYAVDGYAVKIYVDDMLAPINKEIGNIETALDSIIAIQNSLIGG